MSSFNYCCKHFGGIAVGGHVTQSSESWPWVTASVAEGLERFVIKDLKPGEYVVRLYFAEPDTLPPKQRLQDIKLQGRYVLRDFDVANEADGVTRGIERDFSNIEVDHDLTLELAAANGKTIISGIERIRQRKHLNTG